MKVRVVGVRRNYRTGVYTAELQQLEGNADEWFEITVPGDTAEKLLKDFGETLELSVSLPDGTVIK